MLVRDRNANASATAIGNVIDSITPESLRVIGNMSRFDILMDKVVVLNNTSDTAGSLQKAFFKKYIKVPTEESLTCYVDGTASIPITNSYSLIYLSDVAASIDDVNIYGQCRMRYVG